MTDPEFLVLMATCNGAARIDRQLASLSRQTVSSWALRVGDDQSSDNTINRITAFAKDNPGRVESVVAMPGGDLPHGIGRAARNFLTLLVQSHDRPDALIAFCDQDDHWYPDKLARAAAALTGHDGPAVYASSFRPTDDRLRPLGRPAVFPAGPSFANALVQGVLCGNTIVANPAAADLLRRTATAAIKAGVPSHDWWIYQVLAGTGAAIIVDPTPTLDYVQHGGNLIGVHRGLASRLARTRLLQNGTYRGWLDANERALLAVAEVLTPAARETALAFAKARQDGPRRTSDAIRALGLHRQTRAGTMALWLAARRGWL
ncbi:glycosyltransferase [Marivivens marinus]|uniref:glycosyltransferase n=1 Tax=Marivivens marinus TaxID=3110173 RepID=UPI003B848489